MRFKIGEKARLAYVRYNNNAAALGYVPGIEVEVVAIGPFKRFQMISIGNDVNICNAGGDYIIEWGGPSTACVLDAQLIKLQDPGDKAEETEEELEHVAL